MTHSTPDPVPAEPRDLFEQVDPFAALMDARAQLLAVIELSTSADRVTAALGAVIAHDDALREVATRYAGGDANPGDVELPADRRDARTQPASMEEAHAVRRAFFEALSTIAHALDEVVDTPWGGSETWRMHLVVHAIHDGLHADALSTGAPLPDAIAARSDSR